MDRPPKRIVVLISGSGTNLQALIDAQNTPALPNARIVRVISNRKAAHGLVRAASAAPPIPTAYLALQPYLKANPASTRADYDEQIARMVVQESPHLVVLAGWMHVLGERFLDVLAGATQLVGLPRVERPIPVINLHPALPGAFDGANALQRAYDAFQNGKIEKTGAMVHRVIKEVDRGEPVIVREIEIVKGEEIQQLEERLHKVEWEIIVQGAAKVLSEIQSISNEHV